jgi:hypothetical protein
MTPTSTSCRNLLRCILKCRSYGTYNAYLFYIQGLTTLATNYRSYRTLTPKFLDWVYRIVCPMELVIPIHSAYDPEWVTPF